MTGVTVALSVVALLIGVLAGAGGAVLLARRRRARALRSSDPVRLIAFPFAGEAVSEPALRAALRLARVEGATLMPVALVIVPRALALDVPLPVQTSAAFAMLEAVERRAGAAEVAVDSRLEVGRSVRHALTRLMEHERPERIVVAVATAAGAGGFTAEDVAWLLENAPYEVIALRPREAADPRPEPGAHATRPHATHATRAASDQPRGTLSPS